MTAEPHVTSSGDARRSPLGSWASRLRAGSRQGVVELRELAFLTQVGLRVPEAAHTTRQRCADALGVELPGRPGTAAGDGARTVLWLGPDEWLVVDEPGHADQLVRALGEAVAGAHASVVDLSANRTVLELSGPRARDVLASGCQLDLHPRAFGPGSVAATEFARSAVYLHQLDEVRYRLLVRPSFAAYLAAWLLDAMVEHVVAETGEG